MDTLSAIVGLGDLLQLLASKNCSSESRLQQSELQSGVLTSSVKYRRMVDSQAVDYHSSSSIPPLSRC